MTTNRSKKYENVLGRFEYTTVGEDYYPIGIAQLTANEKYTFLIATPEKALCDMLTTTPLLKFQSMTALNTYLEEDIRFDMDALDNMDGSIIEQCIGTGKKKTNLKLLLNRIQQ
jgi:hypothetical protein